MTGRQPTALLADDEPLLRVALERQLGEIWPELTIVAHARNGREAVDQFIKHRPDVCFLDVHMPGLSGIEAARQIGRDAHIVFVTAFDQYAVEAFEQGVLDYLVKPVEPKRLAESVLRLKERLQAAHPAPDSEALLEKLAERLGENADPKPLRWIRASVGSALRMISVDNVEYLRSDEKYTRVAWRRDDGSPQESLIRTPLRELAGQLDTTEFVQVHRSVVVNLNAVDYVSRNDNDTGTIFLKCRKETLPVSRSNLHLFRLM